MLSLTTPPPPRARRLLEDILSFPIFDKSYRNGLTRTIRHKKAELYFWTKYIYFFDWSLKNVIFCRVSPISTRLFCYITCTFKRPSLRLLRFKISQFVPFLHKFDRFCGVLIKKRANLNLSNRRLVRLKVHVMLQKSLVLMRETLQKI